MIWLILTSKKEASNAKVIPGAGTILCQTRLANTHDKTTQSEVYKDQKNWRKILKKDNKWRVDISIDVSTKLDWASAER